MFLAVAKARRASAIRPLGGIAGIALLQRRPAGPLAAPTGCALFGFRADRAVFRECFADARIRIAPGGVAADVGAHVLARFAHAGRLRADAGHAHVRCCAFETLGAVGTLGTFRKRSRASTCTRTREVSFTDEEPEIVIELEAGLVDLGCHGKDAREARVGPVIVTFGAPVRMACAIAVTHAWAAEGSRAAIDVIFADGLAEFAR